MIQQAAVAMHQATQKKGMQLNFEKGKTEALWAIRGKGSKSLKLQIADANGHMYWTSQDMPFRLSVTQSYKHLGTWLQAPPRCACDIQARASLAKSA